MMLMLLLLLVVVVMTLVVVVMVLLLPTHSLSIHPAETAATQHCFSW